MLKKIIKVTLTLLLLAMLTVLIIIPLVKVALYQQQDNDLHLAEKKRYLESIVNLSITAPKEKPNIVIFLLDDMGLQDLGSYGNHAINTPNIDRLAENGSRFTQYYSPSSSCTPSRAALLTGRYAPRAGLSTVVHPSGSKINLFLKYNDLNLRLPSEEILLPEVLKASGYSTGMIGKWHLGDQSPSLPNDFGFDYFFGAQYSNDMHPFALYENTEVAVADPVDQRLLNKYYVDKALSFIDSTNTEQPFFLYYAHNFPHVPLYSSAEQSGKSKGGLYGDVMEDIDTGIGKIIVTLEKKGILDNTLIILTSDNGPWYQGSAGDSRGRKLQTWDGGSKVPFIVVWPDNVPANTLQNIAISGVDIFPTLLSFLDLPLPQDRVIDGNDISPILTGKDQVNVDSSYLYYFNAQTLDAVRDQRFKYHRRRGVHAADFGDVISLNAMRGPLLFDYQVDSQESYDVSATYPDEFLRMQRIFNNKLAEMKDNPRGWIE